MALLVTATWAITRGDRAKKMWGWWRGKVCPYQHVAQIRGSLLGEGLWNSSSSVLDPSQWYVVRLLSMSLETGEYCTDNSVFCFCRSGSSKTVCDRLEKCDEALLTQLSLYPLCLTVYKLIGFGVEVLVWAEDPSDWVEWGDNAMSSIFP